MSTPTSPVSPVAAVAAPAQEVLPARPACAMDFFNLTKPRLTLLAAIISAAGYHLGSSGSTNWAGVASAFAATFVLSGGAMTLNQYLERDLDGLMVRTRKRPLPAGRVAPVSAFLLGVVLSVLGIVWLAFGANLVAGAVGALAVASYVMVYTPMKRLSSLNTIVGAVPGALPPVIGYAAATGTLDFQATLLFVIMFLWQLPHFLAIAWVCREDYARAGMPMLTVIDREGGFTARQVVIYSLALLLVSPLPTLVGMAGWIYGVVSVLSGVAFLVMGLKWLMHKDTPGARRVFLASLFHVTLLFLLMTLDKR